MPRRGRGGGNKRGCRGGQGGKGRGRRRVGGGKTEWGW